MREFEERVVSLARTGAMRPSPEGQTRALVSHTTDEASLAETIRRESPRLVCIDAERFNASLAARLNAMDLNCPLVIASDGLVMAALKAHEVGVSSGLWMLEPLLWNDSDALARRLALARWVEEDAHQAPPDGAPAFSVEQLRVGYAPMAAVGSAPRAAVLVQAEYHVAGTGHVPAQRLRRHLWRCGYANEIDRLIVEQVAADLRMGHLESLELFLPLFGAGATERAFARPGVASPFGVEAHRVHVMTAPGPLCGGAGVPQAVGRVFAVRQSDARISTLCLSAAAESGESALRQALAEGRAMDLEILVDDVDRADQIRPLLDAKVDYLAGAVLGWPRDAHELTHLRPPLPGKPKRCGRRPSASRVELPQRASGAH